MKILIRPVFFILSFLFVGTAFSQEVPEFTIQIGNFVNPRPADFKALHKLGFIYAVERPSNHTDVFLGGFASENQAKKIAEALKGQGYGNAFVSKLNTEGGESVSVIQLATKSVGDKIDWEKYLEAGEVYTLLNGKQTKILVGGFADFAEAKTKLADIKKMGFSDAFPKKVNNALLHEVGVFETGGVTKKPLIPLDFAKQEPKEEEKPDARPRSYDDTPIIPQDEPVLIAKGGAVKAPAQKESKSTPASKAKPAAFSFKASVPEIRSNVKRTSAIDLQKVLKSEGTYKGSLDGYYGKGTRTAYEQAMLTDRQLQKYSILAKHTSTPGNEAPVGTLQSHINNLWDNPDAAYDGLERSKAAIAKAYRAYYLYVNDGPSRDVNQLMNGAIDEAYSTWRKAERPHIDPSATYAYEDLDQLLKHLGYIHIVSNENVGIPCWMFRRHPGTALKAFGDKSESELSMETCGGFWEWEEVRLLHTIASDLCTQGHASEGKMAEGNSELARLYHTPTEMEWKERKVLLDWNESVWKGMDLWSTRDPLLLEIETALKISYHQTQVLLEDYFMDEGFDEKNSKGLALAALKSLVGHHFERFI